MTAHVCMPGTNHASLREAMVRDLRGIGGANREEMLALAKRHGQTPEIFDADFATLKERQRLHDEYWASEEGLAIKDARRKVAAAAEALATAKSEYASSGKISDLEQSRDASSKHYSKLANANTPQFQAYSKAMKATAFHGGGDYMDPTNLLIH